METTGYYSGQSEAVRPSYLAERDYVGQQYTATQAPDTAIETFHRMSNDAVELADRIMALVDHACGPQPVPAGIGGDQKSPSAILPSLQVRAEYVSSRVRAAMQYLTRLERELN